MPFSDPDGPTFEDQNVDKGEQTGEQTGERPRSSTVGFHSNRRQADYDSQTRKRDRETVEGFVSEVPSDARSRISTGTISSSATGEPIDPTQRWINEVHSNTGSAHSPTIDPHNESPLRRDLGDKTNARTQEWLQGVVSSTDLGARPTPRQKGDSPPEEGPEKHKDKKQKTK